MKHPRLLSAFTWERSRKYRAITTCEVVVKLNRPQYRGSHRFVLDGRLLASLDNDILTIHEGYASDLCSPAIRIGKWWIGTPTSEREALAAIVHDVTRQLLASKLACIPWDRKDTDDFFFEFLKESNSWVSGIYHRAVSGLVGSLFMRLTARTYKMSCQNHFMTTFHSGVKTLLRPIRA